ncbi:MAG: hypothetical protein QXN53_06075 [Thermoproteota archaeon]
MKRDEVEDLAYDTLETTLQETEVWKLGLNQALKRSMLREC